jgi:hypothetical protein
MQPAMLPHRPDAAINRREMADDPTRAIRKASRKNNKSQGDK